MIRFFYILPVLSVFVFFSCESERQVQFQVSGTNAALYAMSRAAQEGELNFSAPKNLNISLTVLFLFRKIVRLLLNMKLIFRRLIR